jgi:beta-aspartyl-dipeptidase (metallo-type)
MLTLIKNVALYNPNYQGIQDILICFDKIVKLEPNISCSEATIIDKRGFIALPGIIDQHLHITGGGGEGGYQTRTREVNLSRLISGGITTLVGLLGTDSLTQNIEALVAKTKALKQEGITAYCLTGAYNYPSPTLTGSISKDIAYIEEIIGVKLALSDHRESYITTDELKKLAAKVRVASMIAGKPGILTLHMGDDERGLEQIFTILTETSLPIWHFRPTHVTRNEKLFQDSLKFLSLGGYIDITVGGNNEKLLNDLAQIDKAYYDFVTFSSDGNGSYSKYDSEGKLSKIGVQSCDGIINSIKYLINNGLSITDVIKFATSNVSKALNLVNKGLEVGKDADIILLDENYDLDTVIALGKKMLINKDIINKGMLE